MPKEAKPGLGRALGANDSVFTRSGPIDADPDVREAYLGNEKKLQHEFDNLQKLLDSNYQVQIEGENENKSKGKTRRQRRKGPNPVAKLSNALQQYKTERIGTEDALIKCIKKVNLDKAILFKEKQGVLWGDFNDDTKEKALDQTMLEMELRREKQCRHDLNVRQKEAYFKLLEFMKERGTKPV